MMFKENYGTLLYLLYENFKRSGWQVTTFTLHKNDIRMRMVSVPEYTYLVKSPKWPYQLTCDGTSV